jgi:hypothetical protein
VAVVIFGLLRSAGLKRSCRASVQWTVRSNLPLDVIVA